MTQEQRSHTRPSSRSCDGRARPDAPSSVGAFKLALRNYAFVDYASQVYTALILLVVLLFHGDRVPGWPFLVAAHAVSLVLVHSLIHLQAARPENKALDWIRNFYPLGLYIGVYRETAMLNHIFVPGFLDPWFIHWEAKLFGGQPSLTFMRSLPWLPVSEIFYGSYFSYYFMLAGVGIALFRRNREWFRHYVSVMSFLFYVCCAIYICTPVVGPPIWFEEIPGYHLPADAIPADLSFPQAVTAGPFYQIMAFIYRNLEGPGGSFPSTHVAMALCTLSFSFRYLRAIRWPHMVLVTLLCMSTVYCRYHYIIDVVAGMLAVSILIPLGNHLYFKYKGVKP